MSALCEDCGKLLPQDRKAREPYPWPRCLRCELKRHPVQKGPEAMPVCRYPGHRSSDWTGAGGKRFCGICHPEAAR